LTVSAEEQRFTRTEKLKHFPIIAAMPAAALSKSA